MKHDLTILTADITIGEIPTDRTLRVAKALGYAAVLHHHADFGWHDPVETNGMRKRVTEARLAYESTLSTQSGPDDLPTPAALADLIAGLPKPVLIVSPDRASIEVLVEIALTLPNGHTGAARAPGATDETAADPNLRTTGADNLAA